MIDSSKINSKDKVFCVAPWLSLNINQNGNVQPCCNSNLIFDNILKNEIKDIWNGESIKEFRKSMIEKIPQESCRPCYEKELSGQKSLRQVFNETFFDEGSKFIYDTNDDYSVNEFGFIHWDVKFSNKCNFKCRSCCPESSSSIEFEEEGKVSGLYDFAAIKFDRLKSYLDKVNHVYFSGGEPLIIEEHYQMLFKLIQLKRHKDPKLCLIYNTNFSNLEYKKYNVLDLWSLFPYVEVHVSVDGTKERGELIRNGFNWNKFVHNVQQFNTKFSNKLETHALHFDCTVQALNIFDIVTLHQTLYQEGLLTHIDNFHLNYLHGPRNLSVWLLDKKTKAKAKKNIENHIDTFLTPNKAFSSTKSFEGLINFMDLYEDQEMIPYFVDRMRYLDSMRKENVFKTFPELNGIWIPYLKEKNLLPK